MNYCKECGKPLKPNAKFCTNCGAAVSIEKKIQNRQEHVKTQAQLQVQKPTKKPTKKPSSMIRKVLLSVVVIGAVLFLVKTFFPEFNDFINPFNSSKKLTVLVGKWHNPTGELLGNPQAIIRLRKQGDAVIGEDENKEIYIQILHYSDNQYSGFVNLRGKSDSFDVTYYKNEDKLLFFSTLTKTSWNLRRVR